MKQLKKDNASHALAVMALSLALGGLLSGCAEQSHAAAATTSISSSLRAEQTSERHAVRPANGAHVDTMSIST